MGMGLPPDKHMQLPKGPVLKKRMPWRQIEIEGF
jgi:hypothetical protein